VVVFKSKTYGHVLALDGVIQVTERDEYAYHEMIAHVPMFSHPNPQRVLVVGGGDGGVLREVMRHKSVTHVTICEIDQMVMDVSKKYFSAMSHVWEDKRLRVVCSDAIAYMQSAEAQNAFDVIICDSSDPLGPAAPLFESAFYRTMHGCLRPGGVISTQAESPWTFKDFILVTRLLRPSACCVGCSDSVACCFACASALTSRSFALFVRRT